MFAFYFIFIIHFFRNSKKFFMFSYSFIYIKHSFLILALYKLITSFIKKIEYILPYGGLIYSILLSIFNKSGT